MAVSQIIGASIADGTIAAIDITDGTITTAKLAATTGSGNVVLSAAPTLTGNTSLVNLTVSGTQTNSTLTSGRVRYSTTGGLLTDSSNLQFDGTNLGVGVTPNAWSSLLVGLQISTSAVFSGQDGSEVMRLGSNWYYSSGFKYIGTGNATVYDQNSGKHAWSTSPSGTAGNAITFTTSMTLDASGYLGIGTTTPSSYGGLAVRKAATVSSVPVSASFSDSANSTFDIRHSPNIVNLSAQGSGITINTGNSTRITITDEGLVGIGTGSPYGILNIKGSNGQLVLANGNTSGGMKLTASNSIYTGNGYLAFEGYANEYGRFDSSGNFGIGTTSPNQLLTLGGSAGTQALSFVTSAYLGDGALIGNIEFSTNSASGGYDNLVNIKAYKTGTNTNDGDLTFWTKQGASSEKMRINAAGSVGIGTSSPATKLDVNGAITALGGNTPSTGGFNMRNVAGTVTPRLTSDGGDGTIIRPGASGAYVAVNNYANSLNLFYITDAGNVGIGTPSPTEKLMVVGPIVVSGQLQGLRAASSTLDFAPAENYTRIIATGSNSSTYASIIFATTTTSTYAERMRITSAGLVGIGTTTPNAKLSINTTTFTSVADTAQVAIENTEAWSQGLAFHIWGSGTYNSGYASGYIGAPNTSGRLFMSGGARVIDNPDGGGNWAKSLNITAASFISVGETGILFSSNSGLTVNTAYSPTLRMKIGTNGYVGIGTGDPYTSLHVVGTIKTAPTNQSGVVAFGGTTDTTTQLGIFRGTANSTSDGNWLNMAGYEGLTFSVSAANIGSQTERMRITSAGLVGIGTTSPNVKFEVGATTLTGAEISAYTTSTAGGDSSKFSFWRNYTNGSSAAFRAAYISNINSDDSYNGSNAQFLGFFTKSGTAEPVERMRITSAGNVGIGTTSPSSFNGDANNLVVGSGSGDEGMSVYGSTSGNYFFAKGTGGSDAYVGYIKYLFASDAMVFATNGGQEKMRITSDGRLRFISPSILNDQQNARIQWVNENSNGVMAQISCVREATSGAPGALVFYTSPNVDTNTYSPIEQMRIDSSGNITTTGNLSTQSIYLGPATGVSTNSIGPRNNPDAHDAASVPSYIYMGGSASVAVKWYRFNSSFNSGYIAFNTHIGGVFAGERSQIDVYGNYIPTVDGTYSIGGSGTRWAAIWASNGTIQTSDLRQKTQISNSTLGLDFIKSLRPVSYKWKVGGKDVRSDFDKGKDETGNYTQIVTDIPGNRTHFGLIAQEVKEVLGDQDFGGYVHDAETDTYALRYDQFISPLIKAIQEQQALIESLTERLTALEGK